jgi:hypothetical protein
MKILEIKLSDYMHCYETLEIYKSNGISKQKENEILLTDLKNN